MIDAKQFTELYKLVYKDMYRFALCMMKNSHDAEDTVSESVMNIKIIFELRNSFL